MGYWVKTDFAAIYANGGEPYYQGNRAHWQDIAVPQRPDKWHTWDGNAWTITLDDYITWKYGIVKAGVAAVDGIDGADTLITNKLASLGYNNEHELANAINLVRLQVAGTATQADTDALNQAAARWQWISDVRNQQQTTQGAIMAATTNADVDTAMNNLTWPAWPG